MKKNTNLKNCSDFNLNWKAVLKNYTILLIGLFIMSFGVALSVKSDLGTTPISCIPNVLKYAVPLSLGMITIIFNFLLIVIQVIILKKDFQRKQWMQLLVTVFFGYYWFCFICFNTFTTNRLYFPVDIMHYQLFYHCIWSLFWSNIKCNSTSGRRCFTGSTACYWYGIWKNKNSFWFFQRNYWWYIIPGTIWYISGNRSWNNICRYSCRLYCKVL